MTEKERARMRAKAQKLSPRPVELPSGAWRCQVMVDGVRHSVTADTPEEAHARALALKAGLIEQRKPPARLTVEEAIDRYIASKDAVLSPSTIRGYEIVKRNRFRELMPRNVYTVTKEDVQRAVNLEASRVSPKTVYNAYGLIRPVLKDCGVDVFGVKLPQRIKPNKRYLQPEEIGALMEAARGDDCEIGVLIAVCLGLRRSEIIGLCWDCVDFDRGTIAVRRVVIPDKDNNWVLREGAKTEQSQRVVSCPAFIMDKLRALYGDGKDGQIFRIHPDTLRKHIHAICKRAGITDTTVHGLRHTNAAVMQSLGVDDAYAMSRGGWGNEATYKGTYSYVFDSVANSADNRINNFFAEKLHTDLTHEKE